MGSMRLLPTVLLSLAFAGCAAFRPLAPEATRGAGAFRAEGAVLPRREEIAYSASWNGIAAGRGVFRFERRGDVYVGDARVETTGVVSLLYGVEVRARAVSGAEDLLSREWSYESGTGGEARRVRVTYDPETGKVRSVIRSRKKVEEVSLEVPGALDPLGIIHALRRSALEPGRSFRATLFTERNLYRAECLVVGRERVRVPAGPRDAFLVRVDIRKVVKGKPEDHGRQAAIWISDDEDRVPVRIDADTKVGRISLRLTRYRRGGPEVTSGRGTH